MSYLWKILFLTLFLKQAAFAASSTPQEQAEVEAIKTQLGTLEAATPHFEVELNDITDDSNARIYFLVRLYRIYQSIESGEDQGQIIGGSIEALREQINQRFERGTSERTLFLSALDTIQRGLQQHTNSQDLFLEVFGGDRFTIMMMGTSNCPIQSSYLSAFNSGVTMIIRFLSWSASIIRPWDSEDRRTSCGIGGGVGSGGDDETEPKTTDGGKKKTPKKKKIEVEDLQDWNVNQDVVGRTFASGAHRQFGNTVRSQHGFGAEAIAQQTVERRARAVTRRRGAETPEPSIETESLSRRVQGLDLQRPLRRSGRAKTQTFFLVSNF